MVILFRAHKSEQASEIITCNTWSMTRYPCLLGCILPYSLFKIVTIVIKEHERKRVRGLCSP